MHSGTKYSKITVHKSNLIKWNNLTSINHIDERIAHIAFVLKNKNKKLVNFMRNINMVSYPKKNKIKLSTKNVTCLEVNWQIKKIIGSSTVLIYCSEKHLRSISVKYILHQLRGRRIKARRQ